MSLFLTEWLTGPVEFEMFCDVAWSPQIKCMLDKDSSVGVRALASFFSPESVISFVVSLDPKMRDAICHRFDLVTGFLLEKVNTKSFIEQNFKSVYSLAGENIEVASLKMTELFNVYLTEIEFWNKIDLVEALVNLMFYGTIDDPKPFVFYIPPMSEWGDGDGWYPGLDVDGEE